MAALKNKRKIAAVSRETPENTKHAQSQNSFDPKMAQEYICQVYEEIEGRVTTKLSKEFSRTESRVLGALSKLDEFLLNPQVRTCSVAVTGKTRNNESGNRETNEDRSPNVPFPGERISSDHSGNLNSSDVEEYPHTSAGVIAYNQPVPAGDQVRNLPQSKPHFHLLAVRSNSNICRMLAKLSSPRVEIMAEIFPV